MEETLESVSNTGSDASKRSHSEDTTNSTKKHKTDDDSEDINDFLNRCFSNSGERKSFPSHDNTDDEEGDDEDVSENGDQATASDDETSEESDISMVLEDDDEDDEDDEISISNEDRLSEAFEVDAAHSGELNDDDFASGSSKKTTQANKQRKQSASMTRELAETVDENLLRTTCGYCSEDETFCVDFVPASGIVKDPDSGCLYIIGYISFLVLVCDNKEFHRFQKIAPAQVDTMHVCKGSLLERQWKERAQAFSREEMRRDLNLMREKLATLPPRDIKRQAHRAELCVRLKIVPETTDVDSLLCRSTLLEYRLRVKLLGERINTFHFMRACASVFKATGALAREQGVVMTQDELARFSKTSARNCIGGLPVFFNCAADLQFVQHEPYARAFLSDDKAPIVPPAQSVSSMLAPVNQAGSREKHVFRPSSSERHKSRRKTFRCCTPDAMDLLLRDEQAYTKINKPVLKVWSNSRQASEIYQNRADNRDMRMKIEDSDFVRRFRDLSKYNLYASMQCFEFAHIGAKERDAITSLVALSAVNSNTAKNAVNSLIQGNPFAPFGVDRGDITRDSLFGDNTFVVDPKTRLPCEATHYWYMEFGSALFSDTEWFLMIVLGINAALFVMRNSFVDKVAEILRSDSPVDILLALRLSDSRDGYMENFVSMHAEVRRPLVERVARLQLCKEKNIDPFDYDQARTIDKKELEVLTDLLFASLKVMWRFARADKANVSREDRVVVSELLVDNKEHLRYFFPQNENSGLAMFECRSVEKASDVGDDTNDEQTMRVGMCLRHHYQIDEFIVKKLMSASDGTDVVRADTVDAMLCVTADIMRNIIGKNRDCLVIVQSKRMEGVAREQLEALLDVKLFPKWRVVSIEGGDLDFPREYVPIFLYVHHTTMSVLAKTLSVLKERSRYIFAGLALSRGSVFGDFYRGPSPIDALFFAQPNQRAAHKLFAVRAQRNAFAFLDDSQHRYRTYTAFNILSWLKEETCITVHDATGKVTKKVPLKCIAKDMPMGPDDYRQFVADYNSVNCLDVGLDHAADIFNAGPETKTERTLFVNIFALPTPDIGVLSRVLFRSERAGLIRSTVNYMPPGCMPTNQAFANSNAKPVDLRERGTRLIVVEPMLTAEEVFARATKEFAYCQHSVKRQFEARKNARTKSRIVSVGAKRNDAQDAQQQSQTASSTKITESLFSYSSDSLYESFLSFATPKLEKMTAGKVFLSYLDCLEKWRLLRLRARQSFDMSTIISLLEDLPSEVVVTNCYEVAFKQRLLAKYRVAACFQPSGQPVTGAANFLQNYELSSMTALPFLYNKLAR